MDDAALVRVLERVEDLHHDALDRRQREALVRLEVVAQLAPADVFHRDVGDRRPAFGDRILAVLVDGDDVRVVEPPRRLRLALEAREDLRRLVAVQALGADGLDRDAALDEGIEPLVHDAHRALAELAPDDVLAELFHRLLRKRRGVAPPRPARLAYLYLASISYTAVCTRRCTMVSRPTPPFALCETPSTLVEVAPTSLLSSW